MSATAGVVAEVQPRSSNWRSRAAPSACVARQPNCWMKKLGIWNHRIEPKTIYAGFAEYTESTEKKRLDPLLSTNPFKDAALRSGLLYKDSGFAAVRKHRYQAPPEFEQLMPRLPFTHRTPPRSNLPPT